MRSTRDDGRPLAVLRDEGRGIEDSEVHFIAGDADRARILFEQAIAASPNNADLHNDYGFFLLTQGEAEQARNHFQTALNLKPDHARATMNLGLLSARAGDHATAESRFASIVGTTAARENVAKIAGQRQLQGSRHYVCWSPIVLM